jgi:hypothetical protein
MGPSLERSPEIDTDHLAENSRIDTLRVILW